MNSSLPAIVYFSAVLTGCLLLAGVALVARYRRETPRALQTLVGVIVGVSLFLNTT